jgi:predicted nucleic-acid-binding protein
MIGLDTNVLVRYITQDDAVQAERATRLIESRRTAESPGLVADVVLCELVWVLSRAYGYDKAQVVGVLEQLLSSLELRVQNIAVACSALEAYRTGGADFSDYLLALTNREAGCAVTYSFDRRLCAHDQAREPE